MSIVFSPTPWQNCLRPADEPPDSTTGRLELVEGLAELLSHDVGVRQNGRRTGNLNLVASGSGRCECKRACNCCGSREGNELVVHANLPDRFDL